MSASNVGPVAGGSFTATGGGGALFLDSVNQIANSAQLGSVGNGSLALTVGGLLTASAGLALSGGSVTGLAGISTYSGSADAVTFANSINVALFTSTGPDAATLATPVAADNGKILILINTNTTQNVVTTAANKILNGTATPGDTLTAPAHAGAVTILVAGSLFWNMAVLGTGTWVLTEV